MSDKKREISQTLVNAELSLSEDSSTKFRVNTMELSKPVLKLRRNKLAKHAFGNESNKFDCDDDYDNDDDIYLNTGTSNPCNTMKSPADEIMESVGLETSDEAKTIKP